MYLSIHAAIYPHKYARTADVMYAYYDYAHDTPPVLKRPRMAAPDGHDG